MNLAPENKLVLGTVQMGLPYGINNQTGKPTEEEVFNILEYARLRGIMLLDTADLYGNSIELIGTYLKKTAGQPFRIISKFVEDETPVSQKISHTLDTLGISQLYGYMYHRFSDYISGRYKPQLLKARHENVIANIGVSIYHLEELRESLHDPGISLIQIPLNPFDQSPEKIELLNQARELGKEVHVRSVFLQGLLFKKPQELTGNLRGLHDPLTLFHQIVSDYKLEVREVCLNYALHQKCVDYVVIGVENRLQLDENLKAIIPRFPQEVLTALQAIQITDQSLINPSNWKP